MPANLQGLNIVHPVQQHHDNHDLLAGQSFPDLSAQLELWTNLAFECDEGPLLKPDERRKNRTGAGEEEEEEAALSLSRGEAAIHDGHVNVVTPVDHQQHHPHQQQDQRQQVPTQLGAFDLNAFLAGFGIDPYSAPPLLQNQPPHPSTGIAPSLAQLIALHANPLVPAPPPPTPVPGAFAIRRPSAEESASASYAPPPAKRSRTRKASVSVSSTGVSPAPESPEDYREETPGTASAPAPGQGISAAEDKRRRNTAASARFRLKKKEREAALEGRAKELETRVSELERECEGLRRENGWLKGLVVGVTGAAQGPVAATAGAGVKRNRDEVEA
ncbi:hypothetical protein H0H81_001577 [Sphagnurus paluster]|uniref:BZIP domain-containing protein n=1 Tax=Sphagnurus paluster TaxID=117069 RepID=A0A9P7FY76_9AGAR|nr:hypothetical protein H0H81_001577 [Sphagnurus paluster]